MDIIIAKKGSSPTIQNIIGEMEEAIKPVLYSISRHRSVETPESADIAIRWGCTATIGTEYELEYNKADLIKLTSNKGECRRLLYENNIPVPEIVDLHHVNVDDIPFVVRPAFHQKGKDFLLFETLGDVLENGYKIKELSSPYASRFYPKTKEYRVHVGSGKVLAVQEKVQTSDTHGKNWSHENGYTFEVVKWKDYRKDIVDLAVRVMSVVGLDFGAVDIMSDPVDSSLPIAVVCEINTAPKLEDYTAERYAEYFDWILKTRETRHFEIPQDLSPRHYVFKHRELRGEGYDLNFKTEMSINF